MSTETGTETTRAILTASGVASNTYRRYDANGVLIGPWTRQVSRANALWAERQRARFRQR